MTDEISLKPSRDEVAFYGVTDTQPFSWVQWLNYASLLFSTVHDQLSVIRLTPPVTKNEWLFQTGRLALLTDNDTANCGYHWRHGVKHKRKAVKERRKSGLAESPVYTKHRTPILICYLNLWHTFQSTDVYSVDPVLKIKNKKKLICKLYELKWESTVMVIFLFQVTWCPVPCITCSVWAQRVQG